MRLNESHNENVFSKTFKMNLTPKSKILLLKIENWIILFQDWLNFHSLKWDSTSKNLKVQITNVANNDVYIKKREKRK